MNKLVIIFGPSASGKSTLATQMVESLPGLAVAINQDSYYFGSKGDNPTNFDHPSALDSKLLTQHIYELVINNVPIQSPVYDYKSHMRSNEVHTINPKPLIILEGLLLAAYENLLDMSDTTIYCDVPLDICLIRRIRRDLSERDRCLDSVLTQDEKQVRPQCLEYVQGKRELADKFYNGENFEEVLTDIKKLYR